MTHERFTVEVSLALGVDPSADPATWAWTVIPSEKVLTREGGIRIHRGRADWQSQAQASWCEVLVDNADGRFSRLNPLGAYYGTLNKNTPLRVRACATGGTLTTRFVGFVSEWPPRWNLGETHFWVPLRADGVLRRLGRGSKPVLSALTRTIQRGVAGQMPFAYWPCEDGAGSLQAASGLPNGTPMTVAGSLTFAAVSAGAGSAALPDFSAGGRLSATAPQEQSGTSWGVHCVAVGAGTPVTTTLMSWTTSGSPINAWTLIITSGGTLQLAGAGTVLASGAVTFWDGEGHSIVAGADNDGTGVILWLYIDNTLVATPTQASQTAGKLAEILANPLAATNSVSALGQIACYDSTVGGVPLEGSLTTALSGNIGEAAGNRFSAVCAGEGIQASTSGASTSELMGAQSAATVLDVLRSCEDADGALLVERLTGKLGFDAHTTRENVAVVLALDYAAAHIAPPFEPADDDQATVNDVTVTRIGGSSARVVDEDSEAAVGRNEITHTHNLYSDDQLIHHAGWHLNLGTVGSDEYHYPVVNLRLHRSSSLITTWLTCDIGSRVTIDNLPTPPYSVDQIIEGYTEQITRHEWSVALNLSPYKPYKIFTIADTTADAGAYVGRLAGDDQAAIRAAISSGATSIAFDPNRYRWTTAADDFDPDLRVRLGGETVDVSTISTTPGTFVAVGTVAHANNANVTPGLPAGVQTGDLLLIFAAIRNSGTGVPNTPTGYTRLPAFNSGDNAQLFAKVHSGSESNPTVSFTGGVAGADCSAQMSALRGTPVTLDDLADIVVDSRTQLNGSGTTIPYPGLYTKTQEGCIILVLGWNAENWTSVATLSGFTEIDEPDTVVGTAQGIVWDYQIQTTPAVINEGAFVITGSAAAISRSAVVAIAAGYQTMTISARAVNGVVKAHTAATKVEVENAYVMGL